MHAITFEVGAVLPDPEWQAPAYCFDESGPQDDAAEVASTAHFRPLDMFKQLSLLDNRDVLKLSLPGA